MSAQKCPNCGAELKAGILGGLCPQCVLSKVMAEPESGGEKFDAGGQMPEDRGPGPVTGQPGLSPTVSVAPPLSEQPGDRIGRYKLLQNLGQGGMGSVWMAEQTEPVRRMVALKVIKAGMDSAEVLARFEAERQALALMDHPNIARVLDAGASPNGRPYFVMDLVKGIPLLQFCDEQRLPVRERLELFMQVCQAVQHAHQKGIIHRDLKPTNVLVALYDGKPVPKVIDFGVAKATGQRLTERTLFTQLGALVGTLEYMSPEQAEFNQLDIDTRSDIYSLGVLLYELLTGTTPLTRDTLCQGAFEEVLRRIREEEPPKPSLRLSTSGERLPVISAQRKLEPEKLTRVVRGELDWIVMKALEKDRSRRYETANGFAADLQHYLNGEKVAAVPPTAAYRLRKFVWGQSARAIMGIFLVALGLGTTAILVGVGVMMTERDATDLVFLLLGCFFGMATLLGGVLLLTTVSMKTKPIALRATRNAPLAIWSLGLGILSMACFGLFAGIPAVVCGLKAQERIKASDGSLQGDGLALAGLIMGYVGIVFSLFTIPTLLTVGIPNYVKARAAYHKAACVLNLRVMEGAKATWALENKKGNADTPTDRDIFGPDKYVREKPICKAGGTYTLNRVGANSTCSIPGHSLDQSLKPSDIRAFGPSALPGGGYPPRDFLAATNLIDLSRFYNVRLDQDFKDKDTNSPGGFKIYSLSALPRGVTHLGETDFDLRGAVLLTSSVLRKYPLSFPEQIFPEQIKSIPLASACRRLHFLHAAGWPETTGTRIGYYRLHYADGKEEQVPMVYGQNIDDCVVSKNSPATKANLVWKGTNSFGTVLRLFHTAWENPRPGTVIESMDFVSHATKSAPLLIAITVE